MNGKRTPAAQKAAWAMLWGTLRLIGLALALCALYALLVIRGMVGQNTLRVATPVLLGIAAFAAALLCGQGTKTNRLPRAMLPVGIFALLALVCQLIFVRSGVGGAPAVLGALAGGTLLGCLPGKSPAHRAVRRRH